jgi:hypothetical protein
LVFSSTLRAWLSFSSTCENSEIGRRARSGYGSSALPVPSRPTFLRPRPQHFPFETCSTLRRTFSPSGTGMGIWGLRGEQIVRIHLSIFEQRISSGSRDAQGFCMWRICAGTSPSPSSRLMLVVGTHFVSSLENTTCPHTSKTRYYERFYRRKALPVILFLRTIAKKILGEVRQAAASSLRTAPRIPIYGNIPVLALQPRKERYRNKTAFEALATSNSHLALVH